MDAPADTVKLVKEATWLFRSVGLDIRSTAGLVAFRDLSHFFKVLHEEGGKSMAHPLVPVLNWR
jgi:hypothetical protein